MTFVGRGGLGLRGLSRNLVCVVIAYDYHGNYYASVLEKTGNPGSSLVIHDGDHSHHELIGLLGLKEKVIRTSEKDPKKRKLMKTIDSACGLLKFEVAKH